MVGMAREWARAPANMAGRYQPGAGGAPTNSWEHFTTTRPFKRCANCDASMISSDPGNKCSRCELSEQKGPETGASWYNKHPTEAAKANNSNRERPGPKDDSNDDYGI